jgi:hypothetical protein
VIVNGKIAATRASELAEWLQRTPFCFCPLAQNITGKDWQSKIKGTTGVVYFADYWIRTGANGKPIERNPTGDHIDLWNGVRMTASGFSGTLVTIARFGLGVRSGPGFSDLGNSKRILFWRFV